ncbi:hypothetical protein OIU76_026083 [Salix suchowensis]|nr:hypothetical protein OIU76_026083 [Salix suchowensis]
MYCEEVRKGRCGKGKGYASSNVTINGLGCIAWCDGKLTDIRKFVDGQDFCLRVDAEELAASTRKNSAQFRARTLVFIGVPVVLLVFVLALCSFYLWRRHAKKERCVEKDKIPMWEGRRRRLPKDD